VPMVFAGDELGLEGVIGEDSRRPMPWAKVEEMVSTSSTGGGPGSTGGGPGSTGGGPGSTGGGPGSTGGGPGSTGGGPGSTGGGPGSTGEGDSTLEVYAGLARLRREHIALRRGGLEWERVEDDLISFVREHPEGSVRITARRAAGPVPGTDVLFQTGSPDGPGFTVQRAG